MKPITLTPNQIEAIRKAAHEQHTAEQPAAGALSALILNEATRMALELTRRATIDQFKGAKFSEAELGILAETAVAAAIPQLLQGITTKKLQCLHH